MVLQLLSKRRCKAIKLSPTASERLLLQWGDVIGPCKLCDMGTNYTEIQALAGKSALWR